MTSPGDQIAVIAAPVDIRGRAFEVATICLQYGAPGSSQKSFKPLGSRHARRGAPSARPRCCHRNPAARNVPAFPQRHAQTVFPRSSLIWLRSVTRPLGFVPSRADLASFRHCAHRPCVVSPPYPPPAFAVAAPYTLRKSNPLITWVLWPRMEPNPAPAGLLTAASC